MLKYSLVALVLVFASHSLADVPEKKVATCELSLHQSGRDYLIANMDIFFSEIEEEGRLRFSYTMGNGNDETVIQFTDNVLDEGVAFLVPGAAKLYTSNGGTESSDGSEVRTAAIFLENKAGVIRGVLKVEYFEVNVACKAQ